MELKKLNGLDQAIPPRRTVKNLERLVGPWRQGSAAGGCCGRQFQHGLIWHGSHFAWWVYSMTLAVSMRGTRQEGAAEPILPKHLLPILEGQSGASCPVEPCLFHVSRRAVSDDKCCGLGGLARLDWEASWNLQYALFQQTSQD